MDGFAAASTLFGILCLIATFAGVRLAGGLRSGNFTSFKVQRAMGFAAVATALTFDLGGVLLLAHLFASML